MFTVIETEMYWRRDLYKSAPQTVWIVWCGWKDQYSAAWIRFDEACRDAALKEWHYRLATGQATAADRGSH